ncbi:CidA/LrgA family holin-like protein [Sporosarcina pasteurii]|uniref:Holin-like protein n=1 Tax=Sporosarcina pasteurii TaxID=1474 RepID=A0A380BUG5_SPOPA|nr:CidA/LrgA family holin-like protein [Sporosarcina pasteurii]MDS9471283.1 CidA/LrgA family holin-like protein [Sporosarcina pasteurii]QBQ05086.1 CidA/LrgA family holin-like protein [Sporosarcina pasteurii]SUJ06779.1 holin-like protein [Sporosarcina pasteurii]
MKKILDIPLKKIFLIIIQIAGLYLLSVLGEFISNLLSLSIPGSIIGLLLLLVGLHLRIIPESFIQEGAGLLLIILPLFFIPATVGIVQHPEFLSVKGIFLILIVMISTFLTMIVAGRMSEWYEKKQVKEES